MCMAMYFIVIALRNFITYTVYNQSACSPMPLSAHQQSAISMAFRWWAESDPLICAFFATIINCTLGASMLLRIIIILEVIYL